MNELLYSPKIKPEHLAREAIVYLRQSSERQGRQNLESQRLQYEMAERIRGLGWQQIEIIDLTSGARRRIEYPEPVYAASLGEAAFGIFPNLAGKRRGVQ